MELLLRVRSHDLPHEGEEIGCGVPFGEPMEDFRLSFDDSSNLMTTAFSLDGVATWQSPFPGECWAETFCPVGTRRNTRKQFIGQPGSPGAAFVD